MKTKKIFEWLIGAILVFLLILLIYAARFIFVPIIRLIGAVAFPIIGAGILYYLTKPLLRFFERLKIPRIPAILFVFVILFLIAFLFGIFIWPILRDQTVHLIEKIPMMLNIVRDFTGYWETNGFGMPEQVVYTVDGFIDDLPSRLENLVHYLFAFLGGIIGQVISIFAGIVLIPFFLFFMLKDGEKLLPFITKFFKKKKAANIRNLLLKIDHVLTAFIRGQLIVSFSVGVLLFIGYSIIQLNYALALALFGMIMNVIPYLGPVLAVTPAIVVGAFQDPWNIIWVTIIMIVAQQIESNLISPNVMGQVLNLHPLTVITVILAAGSIAGFLGILFAVPFYAVLRTIIVHFYETYADSKGNKEDALI